MTKRIWVYEIELQSPQGRQTLLASRIGAARLKAQRATRFGVCSTCKATIWHLLKGGGREMVAHYERGEEV